eukprot:582431_1
MGRSQVARNQRGRGRGRTQGRGDTSSTGINRGNHAQTKTSSNRSNVRKDKDNHNRPSRHPLGDNSFRYQDDKDEGHGQGHVQGQAIDEYDWDINNAFKFSPVIDDDSAAEIESLSFAQISIHGNDNDNNNVTSTNGNGEEKEGEHSYEINLAKLSACIDSAPTSEWMRLSPGMTKVFDARFADATMETERMTISEMARSSRHHDHDVSVPAQAQAPAVPSVPVPIDKKSEESEVPAHEKENSDSDLDSSDSDDNDEEWLDSIID